MEDKNTHVDDLTDKYRKDLLEAGVADAFIMVRDPDRDCASSTFRMGAGYWIYGACKQECIELERSWEMDNVEASRKGDDY